MAARKPRLRRQQNSYEEEQRRLRASFTIEGHRRAPSLGTAGAQDTIFHSMDRPTGRASHQYSSNRSLASSEYFGWSPTVSCYHLSWSSCVGNEHHVPTVTAALEGNDISRLQDVREEIERGNLSAFGPQTDEVFRRLDNLRQQQQALSLKLQEFDMQLTERLEEDDGSVDEGRQTFESFEHRAGPSGDELMGDLHKLASSLRDFGQFTVTTAPSHRPSIDMTRPSDELNNDRASPRMLRRGASQPSIGEIGRSQPLQHQFLREDETHVSMPDMHSDISP
ncbi:uncharacterized protein MONBRDRAFT_23568 [Monosiga brevicollis MX1]|uniref:Uncharacterized protein n=1 Tax=Monosiga brevicollis TaxID=81824 RepID=A9UTU1_MONBE|nr:uncharacterized protein MONBRDRAFT_23568 [Monosiga brevicollis MX1]EDQ91552.1 predicted protein [Monosiga brevicollis MX1]|eukprot:XP_001743974.1 hypothetical protein [Monosiga brevicollis MX1]